MTKKFGILVYQNELEEFKEVLEAHDFTDYEVGEKMVGVFLISITAQESDNLTLAKLAKSTLWSRQKDFE